MDLNMLRYFVTVADEGSISRAAEVLFYHSPRSASRFSGWKRR